MFPPTQDSKTLPSNTGLDSQTGFTVAIDWLDITLRKISNLSEVYDVIGEVETLTGDEIDFSYLRPIYNGRRWDGHGRGIKGTMVFYSNPSEDEAGNHKPATLKFVMSGSVIGNAHQDAIALWLHGRQVKNDVDCTRIDIALDDHEKIIELGKITEAHKQGNFFNASDSAYHESGKRGQPIGVTLYFGSTKSDKRLCIYDKTIESNGRINGNRWEARFRRLAAGEALKQWIDVSIDETKDLTRWFSDCVTGVIDFRDRSGDDPNRCRCPRLPWYTRLLSALRSTPIRIRVAAPVQSVQKTIKWIGKSVAPSLAILKRVLKGDFPAYLDGMISEGGEKISNVKRRMACSTDPNLLVW